MSLEDISSMLSTTIEERGPWETSGGGGGKALKLMVRRAPALYEDWDRHRGEKRGPLNFW